jgi:hypothetical protein
LINRGQMITQQGLILNVDAYADPIRQSNR